MTNIDKHSLMVTAKVVATVVVIPFLWWLGNEALASRDFRTLTTSNRWTASDQAAFSQSQHESLSAVVASFGHQITTTTTAFLQQHSATQTLLSENLIAFSTQLQFHAQSIDENKERVRRLEEAVYSMRSDIAAIRGSLEKE